MRDLGLRVRIAAVVGAVGAVVAVTMTVAVPALLGLPAHEQRISHNELVILGAPAVGALVFLTLRALEPLDRWRRRPTPEHRAAARAAAALVPDRLARWGAVIGLGAIVAGAVIELAWSVPARSVLAAALCDLALLAGALPSMILYTRAALGPLTLELANEMRPPGRALSLRVKISVLVAALGTLGIVPPAVIGAARLDQVAAEARQSDDFTRALALAAQVAPLPTPELRARVRALPRAVVLDDRGELDPPDARGHVDTLVALAAPPHVGWSVGFREPETTPTRNLRAALLLTMLALLAVAASLGDQTATRVQSDLERVGAKISELAHGELGDPLPRASVQSAEVRALVESTNDLLGRMSDLKIGRFVAIERAIEADRAKTQFFANMSHDLRSPITSILGYSELLKKGIEGDVTAPQKEALERIQVLGEQVLDLVGEILDWARVSAGALELHLSWTPAVELIDQAAREARARLPAGLLLDAEPAAGLPQMLLDRHRAAAAVAAFARATGHFATSGRVLMRARAAEAPGIGDALVISVEGSTALPADEATRALEPLHPWPGDGLGLRLPLARRVIEMHGGRVEVATGSGAGALWVLTLPVGRIVHRRSARRA
ncbi:MAG TPA: HAMP domain-containing sensor histidine kinase [Polyangia bacterium]|nr:HAMP domain-containing sensor histidine kinase [Polyangia bacterium]